MRRSMVVVLLAAFVAACSGKGQEANDAELLRAQATIAPFKSELVEALTTAVAADPVQAIDVCKVRAPQIAQSISQDGVEVGRTSDRLRNPDNSPPAWVHPWLRHYLDEHPNDKLPHAVYVDDKTIGYVEPIYMKPLCLTCHGENVAPQIAARIDSLYPHDQARGYKAGEFRGLFWLTMPANEEGGS